MAPEAAKKVVDAWYDEPFDWGRESSVINKLKFKEMDDRNLKKPEFINWKMGLEPDD